MRTTLNVDDDLMRAAKALAAQQGTTLTAIVERALRELLVSASAPTHHRLSLPVIEGRQPTADVSDRDALFEAMEA